jgi:hypothetical protein
MEEHFCKLLTQSEKICWKCEIILNIDILVSTHKNYGSNGGKTKPYPHHDSFSLLRVSAEFGYKLCKLAVLAAGQRPPMKLMSLKGDEAKLYFEFDQWDVLRFRTGKPEEDHRESILFTKDPVKSLGTIPSSGSQTLRLAGAPLLPTPIGSCFVYSIILWYSA